MRQQGTSSSHPFKNFVYMDKGQYQFGYGHGNVYKTSRIRSTLQIHIFINRPIQSGLGCEKLLARDGNLVNIVF